MSSAQNTTTDLVFWDPTGYKFNSASDWNQWRYVADGLGGQIGIRFSATPGFGTWDWDSHSGKAPIASIADKTGVDSFGKNEQTGLATSSVNAIRMQTNMQFVAAQNSYTIELDFSQYKGSKTGGKDGVAGANTFVGVSDIYAGLVYAKTVVTITGTLADGSASNPAAWSLVNGGASPAVPGRGQPSAQLSLAAGVLQGTNKPAPGGMVNSVDTVMGLVRFDAAGHKTLKLRYDLYPVGNNRSPRTDNSALYVASAIPRPVPQVEAPKPVEVPAPKAPEPAKPVEVPAPAPQPVEAPKTTGHCTPDEPVKPSVAISDNAGKGKAPGTKTSYTFNVKNPDGSIAGKGCFTYETPADGGEPQLSAFYYNDKAVGTVKQNSVQTFYFNPDDKNPRFAFVAETPDSGVCSLTADTSLPAQLTGIGGIGPKSYLGKTLDFPKLAEPITVTEDNSSVPMVDLVVVIDSSVSMKDEAAALDTAVALAIETAKTKCPSDLRVTYLGIEGTFKTTRFDTTVKNYLTGTARADEAVLRGRKKGTVEGGGAQEDGARAIEDVTLHFDWRPSAKRAIFFLGDEAFEGGGKDIDQEDIDAANRSISAAKQSDVRVHTYLGTSATKEKQRKALEAEFARVATETGGQAFTSNDALNGFQALLEKVICGSKSSTSTTTEFCCCQEYVE